MADIYYILTKIEVWKRRLGLTHWKIKVDWNGDPGEENEANITWEEDYDSATIRFTPGYTEWSSEHAEWTVVHELTHLVLRDLHVLVKATHGPLPATTRALAGMLFTHELEGVVDRLSGVLVAVAHGRIVHGDATC